MSVTVSPGQISSTPIQRYDRVGQIAPITSNNGANAMTATGVTISNGGIPNPSTRTYGGTSASGLFPFPASPYKVWAGRCALNNPETWEPSFYTTNAAIYGPRTVTAAGTIAASVREPPILVDLRLTRASGQNTDDAAVLRPPDGHGLQHHAALL